MDIGSKLPWVKDKASWSRALPQRSDSNLCVTDRKLEYCGLSDTILLLLLPYYLWSKALKSCNLIDFVSVAYKSCKSCNWIDFVSVAYMLDDTTEGVVKHSSRLQPSINLHAPVSAALVPMYYLEGIKDWVNSVQSFESHRILAPT